MSNPIDIKRKVRDLLTEALPDFTVTWGFSSRDVPRSWCYMGDIAWPEAQWATNRTRQYEMSIPIILNQIVARTSHEDAEAGLIGNLVTIEKVFNADSALRDEGVITWGLAPRSVGTQPNTEGVEAQAVFDLRLTYRP